MNEELIKRIEQRAEIVANDLYESFKKGERTLDNIYSFLGYNLAKYGERADWAEGKEREDAQEEYLTIGRTLDKIREKASKDAITELERIKTKGTLFNKGKINKVLKKYCLSLGSNYE